MSKIKTSEAMRNFFFALFICSVNSIWASALFFTYSDGELADLKGFETNWYLSTDEMKKWDAVIAGEASGRGISFYDKTRIFTYLYVAQADFARLMHQLTGELKGSLDPLSNRLLSFFIPGYQPPKLMVEDVFSEVLGKIVYAKIEQRVLQENAVPHQFAVPQEWQDDFSAGLQVAKWIPWYAKPQQDFWPSPPPEPFRPIWKEQISLIKKEQEPLTDHKLRSIYHWANLAYPGSDDWREIGNNYLWSHLVTLSKTFQVRAGLMVALYDCVAAYTTCKYHYLVARPKKVDPSILYVIPVPKHPSYPAGHAAESAVAATVLSFFFPEESARFKQLADECAASRIWAGIHFPIDNEGGKACGKKVGQKEIEILLKSSL